MLAIVIVGGIILTVIPMAIAGSAALETLDAAVLSEDDPLGFLQWIVSEHPFFLMFAILAITAIVVVAIAIHAFVRAGFIGVYLDGERAAGLSTERDAWKVFTPESWFAYGRRNWWQLFIIYQITWGLYGLVLLIPIVALGAGMLMTMDSDAVVFVGCGGVLLLMSIAFFLGILVTVWTQLALTEAVRLDISAWKAVKAGSSMLRARPGEIFTVVMILFGALIVVMMLFTVLYMMIGALSIIPLMSIVTIPFQIVLSLAQSAVQTFFAGWFIAAFAAIVMSRSHAAVPSQALPPRL